MSMDQNHSTMDNNSDDEVLKSRRTGNSDSELEVRNPGRWGCRRKMKVVNEIKQLEDVVKKLFEEQST